MLFGNLLQSLILCKNFMEIIPLLVKEMDAEAGITRKMLQRVPNDK